MEYAVAAIIGAAVLFYALYKAHKTGYAAGIGVAEKNRADANAKVIEAQNRMAKAASKPVDTSGKLGTGDF